MDASNSSTPHGAALPRTPLGVRPQRALGNGKSVDTPRIMRLRKLVLFSGQAFIILCITFALAEVALRIYNSIKPLPIFYSTSYNRFRGKPFSSDYDSFHLNSRGFKDVEHNAQKAAGTFRILGIGDSFAFGVVPYTNNWLTLLKDKLNCNGKHVELINMGIPGTDPADYLSLFIHEGLELKPDMVLLFILHGE